MRIMGWRVSGGAWVSAVRRRGGIDRVRVRVGAVLFAGLVAFAGLVPAAQAGSQVAVLTASDAEPSQRFGGLVSIDGSRVAVGTDSDVYVFDESGDTWSESAKVSFNGGFLDLDGDSLLVEMGQGADVWTRDGASWTRQGELRPTNLSAEDGAISGDWVALGGDNEAVAMLSRTGAAWTEQEVLRPSSQTLSYGKEVALSGLHLLVGAHGDEDRGGRAGAVFAYGYDGASWVESGKLYASDADGGDRFGRSIGVDSTTAVIAGYGGAYIFEYDGAQWSETTKLVPAVVDDPDDFNLWRVAIDGDVAILGASDGTLEGHAVFVFERGPGGWQETETYEPDDDVISSWAVDVSDPIVAAGAPGSDRVGEDAGAAYLYDVTPSCDGQAATMVGTAGDDLLEGTPGVDIVDAGRGNDTVRAFGGDDIICGGAGDDVIEGGTGSDLIFGGEGDDRINGGASPDIIVGGSGADDVNGAGGDDNLTGGSGADTMRGGPGDDALDGGSGVDVASHTGAPGPIQARLGNGTAIGHGSDTLIDVESLIGSDHDDNLRGDIGDNTLLGGGGDDVLDGLAGSDIISGGEGDDQISGDGGDDELTGGSGKDSIVGGGGSDVLYGSAGADYLDGGKGRDRIIDGGGGVDTVDYGTETRWVDVDLDRGSAFTGSGGEMLWRIERVLGSPFDDQIRGNDSKNVLRGNDGNDLIAGREGDDKLFGDSGNDTLELSDERAGVDVDLSAGTAEGRSSDIVRSFEHVVGTGFDDTIEGNGRPNKLWGGGGNDLLSGRGGDDLLKGQAGDDALIGGGGADDYEGGAGHNAASFELSPRRVIVKLESGIAKGEGKDTLSGIRDVFGSPHDDTILGDDEHNLLVGLGGSDRIKGGDGHDVIAGSAGNDELIGGPGTDTVSFAFASKGLNIDLQARTARGEGQDVVSSMEWIVGGPFDDTIRATGGPNLVEGRAGDDSIFGLAGGDLLNGMQGIDHLDGGSGIDECQNGESHVSCEFIVATGQSRESLRFLGSYPNRRSVYAAGARATAERHASTPE